MFIFWLRLKKQKKWDWYNVHYYSQWRQLLPEVQYLFFFHTKTGTLHFLCSGELSQMDAMHLHVLLYKSKNIFISDKLFIYYSFIWELFLRTLYCRWISIYCQDLDFMLTVILLPYIVYKGADFLFPSCQMPHKPGLNSWFWVERDWMPFIFLKCENKNTMPKLKNTFSHFTPDRHLLKNINNRFQKQIDLQWNDVVYLQIHLLKRTSHIWVWQLMLWLILSHFIIFSEL